MTLDQVQTVHTTALKVYKRCVRVHGDEYLEGHCARASAKLHVALSTHKVESSFLYHHSEMGGHVFLRINDHFVDITARQFDSDLPSVIIKSLDNHGGCYYWKDVMDVSTLRELIAVQKQHKWPSEQWARIR